MSGKRKLEDGNGEPHIEVKFRKDIISNLPSSPRPDVHLHYNDISHKCDKNYRETTDIHHLLQIFPTEVWLLIFQDGNVDDNTLANATNASLFFRELLLPRRVVFLFPAFWNIISVKYHKNIKQNPNNVYQEPLKQKHWCSGIIKLRLVCRTWCDGVDAWYENAEYHWKMRNDTENYYDMKVASLCQKMVCDWEPQQLEKFHLHFTSTHTECKGGMMAIRNPFLGRDIKLIIFSSGRVAGDRSFEGMCQFLSKFGHYIRYATIDIRDILPSMVDCYSKLKSVLELLPNLKGVHLQYTTFTSFKPDKPSRLQSEIDSNPLPTIKSLRLIKIAEAIFPSGIFQEMLRSNGHISNLDFVDGSGQGWNICNMALPNLRQLSYTMRSEVDLTMLVGWNWPLTKLNLDIDHFPFLDWQRVFKMLNEKWADTLVNLVIKLPPSYDSNNRSNLLDQSFTLNLPHLTNLKVEMKSFTSLDFILPMKDSLRFLELQVSQSILSFHVENQYERGTDMENGGKTIKLLSLTDRPLESNIWDLLPKLGRMHFSRTMSISSGDTALKCVSKFIRWKHTREEWEFKMKSESLIKQDLVLNE